MNDQGAMRCGPVPDHADSFAVDAGGQLFFLLGAIDRRVGGGIDDHIGLHTIEQCASVFGAWTGRRSRHDRPASARRRGWRQSARRVRGQFTFIEKAYGQAVRWHQAAGFSRAKNRQPIGATSFSSGVLPSLSDSNGSLTGQSIPISASFQRRPASDAGRTVRCTGR
jgi:hypothetical protein